MKYIDAEKLIAEIERRKKSIDECPFIEAEFGAEMRREGKTQTYNELLSLIASLQQEQPEGVRGTVHHYGGIVHYVVTNQEQLNARLIQFPNDAEVEMFIEARKEE